MGIEKSTDTSSTFSPLLNAAATAPINSSLKSGEASSIIPKSWVLIPLALQYIVKFAKKKLSENR